MKEKVLKVKKICFTLTIALILLSPILVFAESYQGFSLTCECAVSSRKGTASTEGSASPYYNYVSIIVYKDGKSKASDVSRAKTSKAIASASYSLGGLDKALSNHFVCDSNYVAIGDARETIVKYAYTK